MDAEGTYCYPVGGLNCVVLLFFAKMPVLSPVEHIRLDTARYMGAVPLYALSTLVSRNPWISILAWGISLAAMWLASNQFIRFWAQRKKRLLIGDEGWNAARAIASHAWPVQSARGFLWGFTVIGVGNRWAETTGSSFWISSLISGVIGAVVWVVIERLFGD